ncbi:MAG: ABC transporter permease, partial [Bacteroidales bacterium]|nr:ABC transporter permease [Bacteroidales bacterium]
MRNILFIIQKEFIQIFRNKVLMVMLFVIPFVQLLILPFAASFEIKNINLHIVDYSRSTYSQKLISKFSGSSFYNITDISSSYQKAENEIKSGKVNQIIVIPFDFEKNIVNSKKSKIQINTDAVNANAAGLMNAYSMSIIRDFNSNIIDNKSKMPVNVEYSYWYNPELKYSTYMVPGILVLLITIIGIFLTTMNIVKEKETGTIEQINVTPIKKYEFIIGKLIPFWIIALFELALGLLIGRFVYSIH